MSGDSSGTYTQLTEDAPEGPLESAQSHVEDQVNTAVSTDNDCQPNSAISTDNIHARPAAGDDITMEDQGELITDQLSDRSVVSQQQHVSAGRRSLSNDASEIDRRPFVRGYKPYDTIRQTPTVVLTSNGKWVEMRCPVCNCNADQHRKYFNGVRGLRAHLPQAHKSLGDDIIPFGNPDAFIKYCEYAVVSEEMSIEYETWSSRPYKGDPIPIVPVPGKRRATRLEQHSDTESDTSRSSSPEILLAQRTPSTELEAEAPATLVKKIPAIPCKRTFSERSSAVQADVDISQQASQQMSDKRARFSSADDCIRVQPAKRDSFPAGFTGRRSGFPFGARV